MSVLVNNCQLDAVHNMLVFVSDIQEAVQSAHLCLWEDVQLDGLSLVSSEKQSLLDWLHDILSAARDLVVQILVLLVGVVDPSKGGCVDGCVHWVLHRHRGGLASQEEEPLVHKCAVLFVYTTRSEWFLMTYQ